MRSVPQGAAVPKKFVLDFRPATKNACFGDSSQRYCSSGCCFQGTCVHGGAALVVVFKVLVFMAVLL